TVAGAVQRDEALAAGHVVEQRLLLLGRNLIDVGVDDQAVVAGQRLGPQGARLLGVRHVDAAGGHRRLELAEPIRRLVVAAVAYGALVTSDKSRMSAVAARGTMNGTAYREGFGHDRRRVEPTRPEHQSVDLCRTARRSARRGVAAPRPGRSLRGGVRGGRAAAW